MELDGLVNSLNCEESFMFSLLCKYNNKSNAFHGMNNCKMSDKREKNPYMVQVFC